MVDKVSHTNTVGVRCGVTPSYPADVLSETRTFFDDPDTFGTPPTRGLPVKTQEVGSWTGTSPNWVSTTRSSYDVLGRLLDAFDELGRRTAHSYTPPTGGPVTSMSITNALGQITTTAVEPAWGTAVRTTDPNGHVTDVAYDGLGRVGKVWLPGRNAATQTPNVEVDYLVRNTAPSAVTTRTLLPVGGAYRTTISLYDGALRPRQTQTQAPGGGRTISDTVYDSRGLVAWESKEFYDSSNAPPSTTLVGAGQPQIPGIAEYAYDGAGRPTAEIFKALGVEKWRTSYAYGGDRVHLTPPAGGTATTTISDARGQTTAVRQYHGPTPTGSYDETAYTHTERGELASVVDPAGNTWSWAYDQRGQQISATDPDAGTTTSSYDDAGQLRTSTDARGQTLGYTYDALGRRTSVRDGSPTGPKRAEWVYDTLANGIGQLTRSIRYDGGSQYVNEVLGYDEAGRPTGTRVIIPGSGPGLAGTYDTAVTYQPDGSLYTMDLPAIGGLPHEVMVYAYNDVGAPTEIVSSESIYVYSVAYNKLGGLTQRVLGNYGKRTSITYTVDEPTDRLVNTSAVPENKPEVMDLAYSYDPAGNLTRIADSPGSSLPNDTQCFRYDYLRRLTSAWTPTSKAATNCVADPKYLGGVAPYWRDYGYDTVGNRISLTEHASGGAVTASTAYAYPAPGGPRPHTVDSATRTDAGGSTLSTYGYDESGNTIERVIGGDAQTLAWDPDGSVDQITDPAGTTSYVYDADGNRLIRRDPTGQSLYLPGQELRYTNATGSTAATRYYTHLGTTIAVRTAGGVTWSVTDHHNTGEVMIRESDMAVARRRTLPFGETRGTQPTWWAGDKGFVGGTEDPTGLIHLGARLYDAGLGRFVSLDPVMDLSDPQQMHGYAYANSNPTSFSDPSGLIPEDCLEFVCAGYTPGVESANKAAKAKNPCWPTSCSAPSTKRHNLPPGMRYHGGGGAIIAPPEFDPAVAAAAAAAEQAKRQLINAAKTLAKIAMDELGITAALDCFTNGDLGGCAETALNVAASLVGGLAGKLASKYVAPWKWKKGAFLVKRLWKALGELTSGVKNWWKNSRLAKELAEHADGCAVPNSFAPATAVLMADGTTKRIEDVDIGDRVMATDPDTGTTKPQTVVGTIIGHGAKHLVQIAVDTDGHRGDATGVLIATDGHPFWVPQLHDWVNATDLQAGQWLRTSAGTWVQVTAITRWSQIATVHNLTITNTHTYYVAAGTTPVLVHNCGRHASGGTADTSDTYIGRHRAVGAHRAEGLQDADTVASHVRPSVMDRAGPKLSPVASMHTVRKIVFRTRLAEPYHCCPSRGLPMLVVFSALVLPHSTLREDGASFLGYELCGRREWGLH